MEIVPLALLDTHCKLDTLMSDHDVDLINLGMSEEAQPLMAAVQKHITDNVVPIMEEFEALNEEKDDKWIWHLRQLELLEGAKDKAKQAGLWNFFLGTRRLESTSAPSKPWCRRSVA